MRRVLNYTLTASLLIAALWLLNRWLFGLQDIYEFALVIVMATGSHWAGAELRESATPPDPSDWYA
jgi:hypothetical protein